MTAVLNYKLKEMQETQLNNVQVISGTLKIQMFIYSVILAN